MRFSLSMYDLILRDKKEELFLDFLYLQTVARKKKTQKNAEFEVDSLLDDVAPVDGLYDHRCWSGG